MALGWEAAVSRTAIPTRLQLYLTYFSTLTRKSRSKLMVDSSISSYMRSGYNGANPNDNPICGKQVKATCKYTLVTFGIQNAHEFLAYLQTKARASPSRSQTVAQLAKSPTLTSRHLLSATSQIKH